MARSGQGTGEPLRAIPAQGSRRTVPPPGAAPRGNKAALGLVALGLARHVLRSPRFYQAVAMAVIVLGSLRGIGQDSRASTMARLSAWNKREIQRLEHKAERQAAAVKGAAQMARSGPARGLAAARDAEGNKGRTA